MIFNRRKLILFAVVCMLCSGLAFAKGKKENLKYSQESAPYDSVGPGEGGGRGAALYLEENHPSQKEEPSELTPIRDQEKNQSEEEE